MAAQRHLLRRWARSLVFVIGSLGLAAAGGAPPGAAGASDVSAKARMVVTLARFVQWPGARPADERSAWTLCLVNGSPAVAAAFAALSGSDLNGRRLDVVETPRGAPANRCDMVYVDASAAGASGPALSSAAGAAVLTLGSGDGFLAQGGMVEIMIVDDALRFDVDLARLRAAQLTINPGVLKLARQVKS